ncbi:phosphatidylglycerol lysyltransferase domain-containing protein [Arthrobacter sp. Helios]|uniref:bifunctional lysylphosphatidylglycerol flippase/synthetase MprF n=1 Tax=Arthrobacter sp. Helios TaxID=2828862 RepID=UPI00204B28C7|nr:phosphatidylglycerol lysyltransferase domain-containing protein [Arthrobacter sp. Helios]UPO76671.1 phosphatidylglycerol lysyltransferase domain-containing protein [Arthrobacter sp. Helios]
MHSGVPARHRVQRLIRWFADALRGSLRRAPVTLGFVVLFWVLGLLTSTIASGPEEPLLDWVSVSSESLPEYWPSLLLSALWANGLSGYISGTILALVMGLAAEEILGSRRFLAAAAGTQVAGALFATGFAAVSGFFFGDWGRELTAESFVGPVAFLCGAAAAASAGLETLWRRRLRLFLFTVLILLALYSGSFQDVMALGAALAGGFCGPLLFGRRPRMLRRIASTRREARVLVALAVLASAVGPVLAALSSHAVGPLSVLRYLFTYVETTSPQDLADLCADAARRTECSAARFELRAGPAGFFLATLPQVLLVVFSDGLRRGRRFAWLAALILQAGLTLAAGFRIYRYLTGNPAGERYEFGAVEQPLALLLPMLVPVAVMILLAATGKLFTVSAPPGTYRRLTAIVVVSAAVLAACYVAGGYLVRTGFTPEATARALLADLPQRFLPLLELRNHSPVLLPRTLPAAILYEGVGVVFWALTCVLLIRSFLLPAPERHPEDVDRARALLTSQGGSTLSWMTLWTGNSYWFAPTGNSYIAYREGFGVALTVGDPVGPEAERREVIDGFTAFCSEQGTTPCFYSVGAGTEEITSSLGFASLQVAEETVLELGSLAFKGKKFQDLRTALNRAEKSGVRAEWTTYATAPLSVIDQLHVISEEWVADKHMPEMGFTLGGLEEMEDPNVRLLVAVDEDRTVHGVTSWLPVYRDGEIRGWTLDFMRRRSRGFPAAMDFLIASAALSLQEEGYRFLSLSGVPLARARDSAGDEENPPALDWLLDRLGAALEPVYGFRSLLAFKAKFQPHYVPLYMAYPDAASLPAIGNALSRAYLPRVSVGQGLSLARRIVGTPR